MVLRSAKFKFSLLSSVEKFSHKIDEMNFHINSDPLTGLLIAED